MRRRIISTGSPGHSQDSPHVDPKDSMLGLRHILIILFCVFYIHLFLKYRLTFETLFAYFPLEVMEEKFVPFHEMGMNQFDEYAENVLKEKPLSLWLRKRNVFSTTLSRETGIPLITINYLKSGQRKIENLKAHGTKNKDRYATGIKTNMFDTIHSNLFYTLALEGE